MPYCDDIKSAIISLQAQVQVIIENLNSKNNNVDNDEVDVVTPNPPVFSSQEPATVEHVPDSGHVLDTSVVSLEEFINCDTLTTPSHLNSKQLTTQQ